MRRSDSPTNLLLKVARHRHGSWFPGGKPVGIGLEVQHSKLYLDVTWGSTDNNAPVGQAGESTFQGRAAQLWKLIPAGHGWYWLQVKHSGKFLDVTWGSTTQNAPVGQASRSDFDNGAAQLWRFIPVTAAPLQPSPESSPLQISEVK
jgi:hypothetical protein